MDIQIYACDYVLCIHNTEGKCRLDSITINIHGTCDCYVLPIIDDAFYQALENAKKETLQKLDKYLY